MDDMEKKEDLEQKETSAEETEVQEELIEETAEEIQEEFSLEETEEAAPEEASAEMTDVEKPAEKSNIFGIIAGLAVFVALLAYCWLNPMGGSVQDTGVLYARDNSLYYYDMKNEPFLLEEEIADGGSFHYFYSAWGAEVSADGMWVTFARDIDENGLFDLCRTRVQDAYGDVEVIDEDVYDFTVSEDGMSILYRKKGDQSVELCYYNRDAIYVVSQEMGTGEGAYSLSKDGEYLVYQDAYSILHAVKIEENGFVEQKLTDDCPLYTLAEETNILYYVAKAEENYDIYSYDFTVDSPQLIAENASYMELMPNGRDLLYGVKSTEKIPYSELIVDDMAEIDAAMKETDENYEMKLQRDVIREAAANGEGIEPLMLEYYLLSGGEAKLVVDNVVTAVAVADSEKNFITGYKSKDFQPIYLSVVGGGLEMVDMIYYMSLNYGGMEAFLADGSGNIEVLTGSGVLPNTLQVSSDGRKAAYLVENPNTGGNILMQMEVGKAADAAAVQENVEKFAFIGGNGPLCYYYEYANGTGTVASVESNRTITDAAGVEFAKDVREIYYINGIDNTTGVGLMEHWDGKGEPTIVDGDVFAFQYKGGGKAAVIQGYDLLKQTGKLGYYDGKGLKRLDENVTAIFIG